MPFSGPPGGDSPTKIDSVDAVRCVECKAVYPLSTPPAAAESDYYAIQAALSPHIASTTELMSAMSSIWPLIKSPAAAESNASVEARLREALTPSAATKVAYIGEFHFFVDDRNEDGEECTRMVTVPWTTTKEIMKAILDRAISAVGDEAKESEGGVDWDDVRGIAPNATGDLSSEAFIREQRDSWDDQPSSPTAERREIVARLLRNARLVTSVDRLRVEIADVEGLALAILAALDGGAGA